MVETIFSLGLIIFIFGVLAMLYIFVAISNKYPKFLNDRFNKASEVSDKFKLPPTYGKSVPFELLIISYFTYFPKFLKENSKTLYFVNFLGRYSFLIAFLLFFTAFILQQTS